MKQKRILLHVVFWLVQYSLSLYTELYSSTSFTRDPTALLLFQAALAVFLLLLIKMTVTYTLLYVLIRKWIRVPGRIATYLEAMVLILTGTLLMRLTIYFIAWRLIYGEQPELSWFQHSARYLYSMLDLLQVAGIASAIKLFKLRIQAVQHEKKLVQEKLYTEILHLKAQVNPHFLFNTLNSIYSLARSGSELTADATMKLSKILRYMLYETHKRTVSLEEELKVIDDYIELQQLRFGKRLKLEFHRHTEASPYGIAPLLLLPLVENAFKHGSHEGGLILVRLSLKNNILSFGITNPVAEHPHKNKEEDGIGLANIRRQLELLYQDFYFDVFAVENKFTIHLTIDLSAYAGAELFDSRG